MAKIIFIHPISGEQMLANLGPGGNVDAGVVIFDERVDGPLSASLEAAVGTLSGNRSTLAIDPTLVAAKQAVIDAKKAKDDALAAIKAKHDGIKAPSDIPGLPEAKLILVEILQRLKKLEGN